MRHGTPCQIKIRDLLGLGVLVVLPFDSQVALRLFVPSAFAFSYPHLPGFRAERFGYQGYRLALSGFGFLQDCDRAFKVYCPFALTLPCCFSLHTPSLLSVLHDIFRSQSKPEITC